MDGDCSAHHYDLTQVGGAFHIFQKRKTFQIVHIVAFCIDQNDFKTQELPLARIKKIMKLDEDVKVNWGINTPFHYENSLTLS